MAISEIELRFIVNNIKEVIDSVYYVSNISLITKNSLIIKFHHSQKNDISLLISTFGICITKYKYTIIEDNEILKKIKTDLERSKLIDAEVTPGERIVQFVFQNIQGVKYYLIVELFGHGNIMICNDSYKILNILNPINVRHRILKVGLKYFPPPARGVDPLSVTYADFLSLVEKNESENIDLKRWLGRSLSISKKFIELAVHNSKIHNKKVKDLSPSETKILFEELTSVIRDISTGVGHEPSLILDENKNPIDISPVIPKDVGDSSLIKRFDSYSDAIDEFLNYNILNNSTTRNSELEKQIESIGHDLNEQEKAKELVISKSNKLRNFANLLMQNSSAVVSTYYVSSPSSSTSSTSSSSHSSGSTVVSENQDQSMDKLLNDFDAKILSIKGKDYLEIVGEKIPLDKGSFNIPKISSLLFNVAKDMERGLITIETSRAKLQEQLEKIQKQKNKKPLSEIKILTNKEWYEKYRWFLTTDDMLAIGGRDSSSNSVLVRRHLTENDYVFHAEVHGSPFFILKNANNKSVEDISQSILQVSQATISFSRSWKDNLSSADAYWVYPNQVKKGAPTGQYLPKGAFIIEGKRNFVKNLETKLAIGLSFTDERPLLIVGPPISILKRSVCLRKIIPTGFDVVKASKKIKSDFVEYSMKNEFPDGIINHLKNLSIDEIVRILPVGQFKLLPIEKGDLKYEFKVLQKND
jgi:predicted ribosome quality control (RQC) complex YloA/Tae2 family protein